MTSWMSCTTSRPAGWTVCVGFLENDKAHLLDLVAKRYPGTRPSDLYGLRSPDNPTGLTDEEAWELDVASAYKYDIADREDQQELLACIMDGFRAIMSVMTNTEFHPTSYERQASGDSPSSNQQQLVERFFGLSGSGWGGKGK